MSAIISKARNIWKIKNLGDYALKINVEMFNMLEHRFESN